MIHTVFVGGLLCYGLCVNLGDPEIFGVDKPALWRFIFHDLSSSILCINPLCNIGMLRFWGICLCATFTCSHWPSLWHPGCTKPIFKQHPAYEMHSVCIYLAPPESYVIRLICLLYGPIFFLNC